MSYLQSLRSTAPQFSGEIDLLETLYAQKLWHQLTVKLEAVAKTPAFQAAVNLIDLYVFFVKEFEKKLDPSRLVRFLFSAVEQPNETGKVITFLQNVTAEIKDNDAVMCIELKIEEFKLASSDLSTAKTTFEKYQAVVDLGTVTDPFVLSVFHLTSSKYFKFTKNSEQYYKHALAFLSYTTIDDLSVNEQVLFAYDIALAALLGENIFNFGELLQHRIIQVLETGEHAWLYSLLKAFNIGDISAYEQLEKQHTREFTHPKVFQGKVPWLQKKIRVCALVELLFTKPSDDRVVSFAEISQKTKTIINEVEKLLIKTLSLGLIKGFIDEVDQVFRATWVRPRVLDLGQIKGLKDRLADWKGKIEQTTAYLSEEIADSFTS